MIKFTEEKFITEILEELKSVEHDLKHGKERTMLSNIIGRLGTYNWIKNGDDT